MDILILIYLFVLGACLGSFAGAVAWRLEKRRDMVRERSECEHCHHVLGIRDLVPVASWLYLRGKCRYCKKPIGKSALLLEVGLGAVFALSYLVWPLLLSSPLEWAYFVLWLAAYVCLAILFVYDLRHFLLPDRVMLPLVLVGAGLFLIRVVTGDLELGRALLELVLALLPVAGLYGLLYAISGGKWVGFGDVKLGVFIGLALGWQGALLALLLANLIGTLAIVPSMATGRLKRTDHVPFGPFLITATVFALLFGSGIIAWYLGLLGA